MRLVVKKDHRGKHYIVSTAYGLWYGLGMNLDREGAEEIAKAMRASHVDGYEQCQTDIQKALGVTNG